MDLFIYLWLKFKKTKNMKSQSDFQRFWLNITLLEFESVWPAVVSECLLVSKWRRKPVRRIAAGCGVSTGRKFNSV